MKKTIILCLAAIAATVLPMQAGTPKGNISFNPEPGDNRPFGISVGLVTKQITFDEETYPWMILNQLATGELTKKSSPSFRVGLSWSPEFRYGIGLQTGIYYELSTDSYSYNDNSITETSEKISIDEHNLSIPLRIQWRYEIIRDLSIFIYTGPSFDFSVAYNAKVSISMPDMNINETEKVNVYNDDSDLNRFNMLWGVGAGVRWKFLQLNIGGDWGLTSIFKSTAGDDIVAHLNKPFHISISYLF